MTDQEYDSKKYICKPYRGPNGKAWTDIFKPDFFDALQLDGDNYSTYYRFLIMQDALLYAS